MPKLQNSIISLKYVMMKCDFAIAKTANLMGFYPRPIICYVTIISYVLIFERTVRAQKVDMNTVLQSCEHTQQYGRDKPNQNE